VLSATFASMSAPGPEGRPGGLTYPELARLAVVSAAPDELELLPDATRAWLDGARSGGRTGEWTGGSIGFGLDPSVLVEVVFAILTGTIAEVMGDAVTRRRFWGRRRRREPSAPVPALTPEQARQVREVCLVQALNAGVKPSKAALMADAVSGALLLRARDEPPRGA
jgi:hypothetical protein